MVKQKKNKIKGAVSKNQVERDGVEVQGLTGEEVTLLNHLKRGPKFLTWLSNNLSTPKTVVVALAAKLAKRGYDIRFKDDNKGRRTVFINKEENFQADAIKITEASRKIKIGFISELRMGTYQSQISMAHWIYKEIFERENISFAVIVGGLVAGKPTPTIKPDIYIEDPEYLARYATKHFPHSTRFKTYIVGGRRELSMRGGQGYDVIRAVCSVRDDLAAAGELEGTFHVRGVKIKVMSVWDDNSPKTKSYGVEKIVKEMEPAPDIAIFGGNHERMDLSAYGKGPTLAITVPSLHTQMRRQARKGVTPHIGCTIVELNFDDDGMEERKIDLAKNIHVHHINLDDYPVSNDWAKGADDIDLSNVHNGGRLVIEWLLAEGAIPAGELSRRLALHGHKKSKAEVKELIGRLVAGGAKIKYKRDEKRYRIDREWKTQFKPLNLKYEDVFAPLTKAATGACFHFNSKQEMPEVVQTAYDEVSECGVRAVYMPGDITDGVGSCGYPGHDKDVKFLGTDDALDHCVSVFPNTDKGKVVATPERPFKRFSRDMKHKGKPIYIQTIETKGEFKPQKFGIDGNHDRWSYTRYGYSPVRNMAMLLGDELIFLGEPDGSITEQGDVEFDGVFNRLLHGGGGIGYLSGKAQKFLDALKDEGIANGRPTVLHIGNWHTSFLMFQREVVILDACFKYKDSFHVRLGLVSKIGIHVYELFGDKSKGNITRVISNFRNYRPYANKLLDKTIK